MTKIYSYSLPSLAIACCLIIAGYLITPTHTAYACTQCATQSQSTASSERNAKKQALEQFIKDQFKLNFDDSTGLEAWMNDFWDNTIVVKLQQMADQLSATTLYQTFAVGKFFDASIQLDTQRSLQSIKAGIHKNYHPSTGMCQFGSIAKSLAASERKGELNALTLRKRSQDRSLGNVSALSALGVSYDVDSRIAQFKELYCNTADNNGQLISMCKHAGGTGGSDLNRLNKDLDFARTIDAPWTLDIDFSDTDEKEDEVDILALGTNLYGNHLGAITSAVTYIKDENDLKARLYQDARALLAKQSVAENSYNALVAMKSAGTEGAKDYMRSIMKELGVPDESATPDEITDYVLGEKPSYYAQMEVLTKKLYQNPAFFTNLYDKPANVQRKQVAMQAIGLMQKFDLLKSQLRSEANAAILLELALVNAQDKVENSE